MVFYRLRIWRRLEARRIFPFVIGSLVMTMGPGQAPRRRASQCAGRGRMVWEERDAVLSGACCSMTPLSRFRWRGNQMLRSFSNSSAVLFFLGSAIVSSFVGLVFFWLAISSFQRPDSGAIGCQPDGEGSWSVGVYYGKNPFSLVPIELVGSCSVWFSFSRLYFSSNYSRSSLFSMGRLTSRMPTVRRGQSLIQCSPVPRLLMLVSLATSSRILSFSLRYPQSSWDSSRWFCIPLCSLWLKFEPEICGACVVCSLKFLPSQFYL